MPRLIGDWDESNEVWSKRVTLDEDGVWTEHTYMDAAPVLDHAKALHNAGLHSSPSGDMKHIASIPLGLAHHWKMVDGIDILLDKNKTWLRKKLEDPDLKYLRVWTGRINRAGE